MPSGKQSSKPVKPVKPAEPDQDQTFEVIEYAFHAPFHIRNIVWEKQEDADGGMRNVLGHWHPDLEIVYTLVGHAVHYIDGRIHTAHPGALFIVNPLHALRMDRLFATHPPVEERIARLQAMAGGLAQSRVPGVSGGGGPWGGR